jgi:His/Glu/Gln/Arg/opine family amino acid ABC transporter permease subunit
MNLSVIWQYLPLLLKGCVATIEVSILAGVAALMLGVTVAIARVAPIPLLRRAAQWYIELLRGTPVLVIIYFAYYGLPAIGVVLGPMTAAVAALGISSSAYVAEALRGGMESIPRGQIEAGRALGIPYVLTMRRLVIPQILLFLLPALTGEFVVLLKASSLTSIITVRELTWMGQVAAGESFAAVEIYVTVAVLYLLINSVIFQVAQRLEKRRMVYL